MRLAYSEVRLLGGGTIRIWEDWKVEVLGNQTSKMSNYWNVALLDSFDSLK